MPLRNAKFLNHNNNGAEFQLLQNGQASIQNALATGSKALEGIRNIEIDDPYENAKKFNTEIYKRKINSSTENINDILGEALDGGSPVDVGILGDVITDRQKHLREDEVNVIKQNNEVEKNIAEVDIKNADRKMTADRSNQSAYTAYQGQKVQNQRLKNAGAKARMSVEAQKANRTVTFMGPDGTIYKTDSRDFNTAQAKVADTHRQGKVRGLAVEGYARMNGMSLEEAQKKVALMGRTEYNEFAKEESKYKKSVGEYDKSNSNGMSKGMKLATAVNKNYTVDKDTLDEYSKAFKTDKVQTRNIISTIAEKVKKIKGHYDPNETAKYLYEFQKNLDSEKSGVFDSIENYFGDNTAYDDASKTMEKALNNEDPKKPKKKQKKIHIIKNLNFSNTL